MELAKVTEAPFGFLKSERLRNPSVETRRQTRFATKIRCTERRRTRAAARRKAALRCVSRFADGDYVLPAKYFPGQWVITSHAG